MSGKAPSKHNVAALQVDDVVPPFLAKKLEQCRRLSESSPEVGGKFSPVRKGNSLQSPIVSPAQRIVNTQDAAALYVDPELNNLRKKDAFLRSIFNDTKLNHRQKEHIAANILIGKHDSEARGPVFSQKSQRRISPARVGNILTDGHKQRHDHNHRSVELVGGSVNIMAASAKELRQKEVRRKHDEHVKPGVYTWANESISAVPPYKLNAPRSFEGVQPSANRGFIVDAISQHNRAKAKKNADQVRSLKATALQEKSLFGDDLLREVSVKKKLSKFRRKLHVYLQAKGDAQRGDIMRCIDEETIYTFMENFKGYSMSPDVILSLLGASLGSSMSEGVLLLPDNNTSVDRGKSVGYLPVQSSHQELNPHLRELHFDTSVTEDNAHLHGYGGNFSPHNVPPSYSDIPVPTKGNTANGFRVTPRPTSRMGSGFMVKKQTAKDTGVTGDTRARTVNEHMFSVAGSAVGSHTAVTAPFPGNVANMSGREQILISGGGDKSTWITEFNDSCISVVQASSPPAPAPDEYAAAPTDEFALGDTGVMDVEDPTCITDSSQGGSKPLTPNILGNVMRKHMATSATLPSLFPEKVLTEEELLGLGNKTMTFEEIAIKKERAAVMAKRAKKPVTGLAGLKNIKVPKKETTSPERTPIPRFIMTPQSGGEDFFPKSPNPSSVPIEYFGDDC